MSNSDPASLEVAKPEHSCIVKADFLRRMVRVLCMLMCQQQNHSSGFSRRLSPHLPLELC